MRAAVLGRVPGVWSAAAFWVERLVAQRLDAITAMRTDRRNFGRM